MKQFIDKIGAKQDLTFLESKEEDLIKIMNLQFKGPYQFFQACIPAMTEGGSIIQISSATAATTARPATMRPQRQNRK